MPLILPDFQQKISITAKKAAEKAFFEAMNKKFPGGTNFKQDLENRAKLFAEVFDANFSYEIASHIDLYIKSASIVVPPGQAVTAGGYAGATIAPSPNALIS